MNHVATVCTHCGDGCKTTLGVRSVDDGVEIIRGDNRDKSGINGDFLMHQGPLRIRLRQPQGPPDQAARPPGRRQVRPRELGAGAGLRRQKAARDSRQHAAAARSASSARTAPPTKRTTCCRNSRARCWAPTTSIITAPPITPPSRARSPGQQERDSFPARYMTALRRSCCSATIPRSSIPRWPGRSAHQCAPQPCPHLRRESRRNQAARARPKLADRFRRMATPRRSLTLPATTAFLAAAER